MTDTTSLGRTEIERRKADACRVLEEIFPAVDDAALAATMSSTFVNHEAPPGTPPGPASVSYFMHLLDRAFSDQKWTIQQVMADGDLVAIRSTAQRPAHRRFFRSAGDRTDIFLPANAYAAICGRQGCRSTGRYATTPA